MKAKNSSSAARYPAIRPAFTCHRSLLRVAAIGTIGSAMFNALPAAAQSPEDRGPLAVQNWDAGAIEADGLRLRTRVYRPDAVGSFPIVGVIHGSNHDASYHPELASTLASRGMVVVVPDMPCTVWDCDHDRNADAVLALLEWAVQESEDGSSRLAGIVDGERRGLIGHSWGGLTSHLAAARSPLISSLVLLDPNDDGTEGRDASAAILAPTLQLIAQNEGVCNAAWRDAAVRERLTVPNMQATINGSGHCDPGERDVVCSIACGSGDRTKTALFRRYTVAWTACNLVDDTEMATWLGGDAYSDDLDDALLVQVSTVSLGDLPCASDAAVVDEDAGTADVGPDVGLDTGDTADAGFDADDAATDVVNDATSDDPGATDVGEVDTSTDADESSDDASISSDAGTNTGAEPIEGTPRELPAAKPDNGCSAVGPGAGGIGAWLMFGFLGLRRRRISL